MIAKVDATAFLVIVLVAAASAVIVAMFARRLVVPVVVVELVLGIIVGPQVLDLAQVDGFTTFFSNLGLGMLFFFAGYEIDFQRIRGLPVRLGGLGWIASLLVAHAFAVVLWAAGMIDAPVYVACAMSTTAIGTLLPILRDAGELRTPFGTFLLAAGAIGEFGPIVLMTIFLSTDQPLRETAILLAFAALAVVAGVLAIRSAGRGWPALERTLHASSQLAVRLAVLLVIALVALAYELGLDLLLGGFMAGLIFRQAVGDHEVEVLESKLTAIGYGFLIPFFFVVSGMKFDLDALLGSVTALVELPLFVLLFLVVRGGPVMVLYRNQLDQRARRALALFSSAQLPLVVAITAIAVDVGKMDAATASALVGAGILSTLIFPLLALRLRGDRPGAPAPAEPLPATA
ncbi:cation:proton antiporter [Capillimicrobium parvum]|uniref:Na(+)/H(+)-K(+) antiporter GerN n=1 Tax=Capillimicrobium parvum TaxID=2884022 RepID=A0A9E6Y012_9ACTN|nr:cation:proton antiporter [Capillimicrobium parvum]UGS37534.1 Na(+)/H(+)-K(+) antiporter GerN [Capillimicrobium parvum]